MSRIRLAWFRLVEDTIVRYGILPDDIHNFLMKLGSQWTLFLPQRWLQWLNTMAVDLSCGQAIVNGLLQ